MLPAGSAALQTPPATSGVHPRTSPKPSAAALPLCGRPELVRAEAEPPRPPHDTAAHGGAHHDTLGLRRQIDVATTSSGRRLAAGALEPESSLADWIAVAAPPAASRRSPAPALDPIDRPRSSLAGAPAVRPPPASPSSALADKQCFCCSAHCFGLGSMFR
ncbi:mucin-7-like [Ananas comosus]|uniref:Mucin-7-like n=1 Tax=Ananas comosus TaxID=4615 RepID=A0A6P5F6X2_ANACO|nr:mucin-7-like [Ananas comosus]